MDEISVVMTFEKETKHTYRYRVVGSTEVLRTLYIEKRAFKGERPEKITVKINSGVGPREK